MTALAPRCLRDGARLVVSLQLPSVNMLQRRLETTWDVAEAIMAELEAAGIVGPAQRGCIRLVHFKADQVDAALQHLDGPS